MSAATDIAEREAAEAEAEFPDPPDGDQPEPETGDAPEPVDITGATILPEPESRVLVASAEGHEELQKQLKTKVENYKRGMVTLLEQLPGEWFESPFDDLPGFVLPFDPETPEGALKKQMADGYFDAGTRKLKSSPFNVTCPECDGDGRFDNGAKPPNTDYVICWSCHGSGSRDLTMPTPARPVLFTEMAAPAQLPVQPWQPQPTQQPVAASEILTPPAGWHANGSQGADSWSRWPGHPRYGIDPSLSGW